jgi:hypothetical protein
MPDSSNWGLTANLSLPAFDVFSVNVFNMAKDNINSNIIKTKHCQVI